MSTRKYNMRELRTICGLLNRLSEFGFETLNMTHIEPFFCETHYIDYNTTMKKFRVYKKYKGWRRSETYDDIKKKIENALQ